MIEQFLFGALIGAFVFWYVTLVDSRVLRWLVKTNVNILKNEMSNQNNQMKKWKDNLKKIKELV